MGLMEEEVHGIDGRGVYLGWRTGVGLVEIGIWR